jgi:hypothetical protein
MSKFFARFAVMLGNGLIAVILIFGMAVAAQAFLDGKFEAGLGIFLGTLSAATLLGIAVFGFAALLAICDRLEEIAENTRREEDGPHKTVSIRRPAAKAAPVQSAPADWLTEE